MHFECTVSLWLCRIVYSCTHFSMTHKCTIICNFQKTIIKFHNNISNETRCKYYTSLLCFVNHSLNISVCQFIMNWEDFINNDCCITSKNKNNSMCCVIRDFWHCPSPAYIFAGTLSSRYIQLYLKKIIKSFKYCKLKIWPNKMMQSISTRNN